MNNLPIALAIVRRRKMTQGGVTSPTTSPKHEALTELMKAARKPSFASLIGERRLAKGGGVEAAAVDDVDMADTDLDDSLLDDYGCLPDELMDDEEPTDLPDRKRALAQIMHGMKKDFPSE